MLKNYLKIAWRNIWKNKAFSIINITGLALGITCSLLIALWVQDEYSVDSFYNKGSKIYTVLSREYADNKIMGTYDTPGLLADEAKRVVPEIELACGYANNHYYTFAAGEKKIKYEGNFAGADFFKIFNYHLIQGSAETALKGPESISISERMANSLFGDAQSAINKTVRFENYKDLKVTGVFQDIPANASEKFEYLINWDFFIEREPWLKDWDNSGPSTFLRLRADANPKKVDAAIREFVKIYNKQYNPLDRLELGLQRYDQKYLHSNFVNGNISGGRIEYVRLFSIVAIFILLIACINFMNLSTARSLKRAREIGVRKAIGALRSSLVAQFLGEALLFTVISVLISIILLALLLPGFNQLTGKLITIPFNSFSFWISLATLIFLTALIAGSYPALLLSSFKPIAVLKSTFKMGPQSAWLRKALVVFQFALSIIFIVGMMVVSSQLNYIQHKNLGFHRNNLLYVPITGEMMTHFDLFKNEALKIPGIENISQASARPVELENTTGGVEWNGKSPDSKPNFTQLSVGYDFIKTMGSEILEGRDFSNQMADSNNYLINETALQRIAYKNPIGQPLTFWGVKGTIIGVVKDFHFNSLHVAIEPLIIRLTNKRMYGYALVRMDPTRMITALNKLEQLHHDLNPEFPFSHQFADEEYMFQYKSEQVVQQLSRYFASLAILISCMGLLGLVMYTTAQRTREIGIRKVLGASVYSLFSLLSKDFLALVALAILIATPIAWWSMNAWLQNFVYRTPMSWTVFIVAGVAALFIALVTISFQSFKASKANPVAALRAE